MRIDEHVATSSSPEVMILHQEYVRPVWTWLKTTSSSLMFIDVRKEPISSFKLLWNLVERLASLQKPDLLARRALVMSFYMRMHQQWGISLKKTCHNMFRFGSFVSAVTCKRQLMLPSRSFGCFIFIFLNTCFRLFCFKYPICKVNFRQTTSFCTFKAEPRTPQVYEKWCHHGWMRKQPLRLPRWLNSPCWGC